MKMSAIICEYNPLHNGHVEHIKQTKELSGSDTLLLLMSGNFVQRGEPALLNKFDRASLAIQAGADIVLELPTIYALSNAEKFAYGAIKILSAIPTMQHLSFGSEHGDIDTIISLAKFLTDEPDEYKKIFKEQLSRGQSPASSKTAAVLACISSGALDVKNKDLAIESIYSPNSILAIEYVRSLIKSKSTIEPITIKRLGAGYNDNSINDICCSATAIRECFYSGTLGNVENSLPAFVYDFLVKYKSSNSINLEMLSGMIMYKLRSMPAEEIKELYDVCEGLENRIKKYSNYSASYLDLIGAVKTKRYTHARLRRIFMYALLGVTKKIVMKNEKALPYAKVLALKQGRQDILSELSKSKLSLLTRKEDYTAALSSPNADCLKIDLLASDIYALLNSDPSLKLGGLDRSKGVILV